MLLSTLKLRPQPSKVHVKARWAISMMMRNTERTLTLFAGVTVQVDLQIAAFISLRMMQGGEIHTFKLLGRLKPFPQ
jgi:hypothetical protein